MGQLRGFSIKFQRSQWSLPWKDLPLPLLTHYSYFHMKKRAMGLKFSITSGMEVYKEDDGKKMVVWEAEATKECDVSTHDSHVGPTLTLYDYYTQYFATNEVFAMDDALKEWMKSTRDHVIVIVIKASKKVVKACRQRIRFACERSGKYKKFVKKSNRVDRVVKKRVRTTRSKKCPYPFELKCVHTYQGWTVTILNDTHNHPPVSHLEGHAMLGGCPQSRSCCWICHQVLLDLKIY